jgi:TolA-binding protein
MGNARQAMPAAMDVSPRRALDDYDDSRTDKPGSHKLVWTLVVLVLMAAAFYGGLRVSEWWKATPSNPPARDSVAELLKNGRAAFEAGNYQAAAAGFTSAVERDGQNADAHYWLGRAQLEQGEYAKAATSFDNAIGRRPTLYDAYAQAAAAYEAAGDNAKAARMLVRYAEERRKQPATARPENTNSSPH